MFFPFWDPTMILLIPALILAAYAQAKVQSTYAKYSQIRSASGRTGREVAQAILSANGIPDVTVEPGEGYLSDHYDPIKKTIQLSPHNYQDSSIAAVSVAAHECGHAIQHKEGYAALQLRTAIFPLANIGSSLAWIFIFAVIFQLVTLPVEFNASKRAIVQLNRLGLVAPQEQAEAKKVLDAAAL